MPNQFDPRLLELKLLQNIGNGIWRNGVCLALGAGQAEALDIRRTEYADLLLTMFEEGFLSPETDGVRNEVRDYQRNSTVSSRRQLVLWISVQQAFSMSPLLIGAAATLRSYASNFGAIEC